MRTFAVSALREPPFPARRHDGIDLLAGETAGWVESFGLISSGHRLSRLRRADAAGLAARACPEGPVERVRLLADLVSWLFVMDDACDEDGLGEAPTRLAPVVAALLDVLDGQGGTATVPAEAGPLGAALHDLCRRVRAHGRSALLLRFVSRLRDYLLALLWEAANREHRRAPGVAEYVQMRRHTGGVHPSFALTDLALDGLPGAALRTDPALLTVDTLAADLVCWCNDVFSYGKERTAPDGHNLVTVIARESGQDEAAALRAAADRFNDALEAYLAAEADLLATGNEALRPVLTARRNWIRATYDWSLVAARYA
ncbi:terpene synthase family protein [Micromonospora krabiensis]|uniref:Terpene synthase n=1 Tax=Micromonospora krabiensis TaxID=307121 RepID=A0A1C3ND95_9ACTN|nr:terpene synthase family protein [Micromonospora krabiensis]SBV30573.1 Terpene synthase family, metal binding domain [Micromonospora krabiensis]